MILSYWPFTSNELSDAEAFFMATRLLQFWWFLTTHSGTDSWITLLLFFNVFLLGLASCFHFSDPIIDLFSVCFAVELLYQWWWSMLTILSRYVQLFFFNYMCWKQCCSKVQHLVFLVNRIVISILNHFQCKWQYIYPFCYLRLSIETPLFYA